MNDRNTRLFQLIGLFLLALHCLLSSALGQAPSSQKRTITAADGVTMTHAVHVSSDPNKSGEAAYFSPDGTKFVIVLKKGNIKRDTNDYSVLLYHTENALQAPRPDVVLNMSSSSVRDGIAQIRWLDDNDTLVFLGENPGQITQLYSFQVSTRKLNKLTNQPRPLLTYDISRDGGAFVYTLDPPDPSATDTSRERAREVAIEGQDVERIMEGDYSLPKGPELYWQRAGETPRAVSLEKGYFPGGGPVHISPDGGYILFTAELAADRIRPEWLGYSDPYLHQILTTSVKRKAPSSARQYMLIDSQTMSAAPLMDAPAWGSGDVSWSRDGHSLFSSSTYLPLDIADPNERQLRRQAQYAVKINLATRQYERIESSSIPAAPKPGPPVQVTLEQDLNAPPRIYVADSKGQRKTLLLDLNPQFRDLEFGKVETIEVEVNKVRMVAGLYLPPDYQPGKRYPLVIQTHGFWPKEFSMDGLSEWNSGFAARPLAARGVIVLQLANFEDHKKDHDRIGNDRTLGATAQESFKNFNEKLFEGAIDELDKKGIIDRKQIGIVGFSRTVCFVAYTLTHSREKFAAASLVDGVACGYFDAMLSPYFAWDMNAMNGGAAPFGEGLKTWMKEAPGFNLDKVTMPVRLVALDKYSVMGDLWEWYAGLSSQKRPVDFVFIPDATHIFGRPSECLLKQQGLIDWFTFWLQGYEDHDPAKAEQYERWRELRKMQDAQRERPQVRSAQK
jgi:dipeptidyl aminopeptidase/acylaminoacyl peptidase